ASYCQTIGYEDLHISIHKTNGWIQERIEPVEGHFEFTSEVKRDIIQQQTEAEVLERFLHIEYVGYKIVSLEGIDSIITSIVELVNHSGSNGIQEIVVGMAHSCRLNMLVNIMGKMPADLFAEFEGKHSDDLTDGDVKYHNGFSSDLSTRGGPIHLSLALNPSHLEIVNPVVE